MGDILTQTTRRPDVFSITGQLLGKMDVYMTEDSPDTFKKCVPFHLEILPCLLWHRMASKGTPSSFLPCPLIHCTHSSVVFLFQKSFKLSHYPGSYRLQSLSWLSHGFSCLVICLPTSLLCSPLSSDTEQQSKTVCPLCCCEGSVREWIRNKSYHHHYHHHLFRAYLSLVPRPGLAASVNSFINIPPPCNTDVFHKLHFTN